MPLGIQRLNAKKTQPNDRIVFIKPLKGKDETVAQDFLERIAAQCLPIMKEHHLSVTTLEEYEPNREFVGRNFNGSEIIQLVLKARSGHWLPFKYVQMVMMHELAHCVQMNHSRAFWKVRNLYAEQMRTLWGRAYTGEGMWGRGALLGTGEFENNTVVEGEDLPEHLCGGTYRSRRRKRGRKGGVELSYQEKKQQRIEKKFGKNGVSLGADDDVKAKLEKGKRTQAAPRVAGSNRGRELRAAAALARFDEKKREPESEKDGDESNESDYEDVEDIDGGADDAFDIDGQRLLDTKGNHMVKVCEDENPDDVDAANEIKELQSSITTFFSLDKSKDAVANRRPKSDAGPSAARQTRGRSSSLGIDAATANENNVQAEDAAAPLVQGTSKSGSAKPPPKSDREPILLKKGTASCARMY
ncbi:hypothetical protein N0V93_001378 [Gnomoniopsis smithogilvyi]|uniref:WLM domain-containing protein n=1 Tax=Gnomoniopsis smithogilvyi TaxID=1191159 RepID=A0A9W8Z5E8_9PEZI|nr:hypothetical protein N0V93_001378 [Gnomoniopsis smithogilvyi]